MKSFVFFILFQVNFVAFALDPNQVSVLIGGSVHQTNMAYVSITICIPGTVRCQTIDRIQLDTGSTGLRIFSSQVNLKLPAVLAMDKLPVSECFNFGGGDQFFGSLRAADVKIGGLTASNVRLQTIEHPGFTISNCTNPAADAPANGMNGVLGVGLQLDECNGHDPCDTKSFNYYHCQAQGCQTLARSAQVALQNPISKFPSDNRGYVIDLPEPASGSSAGVVGTLTFGLNTHENNKLSPSLTKIATGAAGWFAVKISGLGEKIYSALIDSGTNSFLVPSDTALSGCDFVPGYLCPAADQSYDVLLVNQTLITRVNITSAAHLNLAENFAASQLGLTWPNTENMFVLGIPFFYGRKIYFSFDIDPKTNALLPFVAF